MGASHPAPPRPVAAAITSQHQPDVRVEQAADDGEPRVFVEGTMFHDGLNQNAWGLTQEGAESIADDLVGRDYTAAHPPIRETVYDRSIAHGQGAPIGEVRDTSVAAVEGAMLDGGGYTATYTAEVLDPTFKDRLQAGLTMAEGYGVSIGIYADPEEAQCAACGEAMQSDASDHERFDEVGGEDADDGGEVQIAGPLYPDGNSDHLAHVWMPAYEGATAEVDAAAANDGGIAAASTAATVPTAASALAAPFDADRDDDASESAADDEPDDTTNSTTDDGYRTRLSPAAAAARQLRRARGSYAVRLNDD